MIPDVWSDDAASTSFSFQHWWGKKNKALPLERELGHRDGLSIPKAAQLWVVENPSPPGVVCMLQILLLKDFVFSSWNDFSVDFSLWLEESSRNYILALTIKISIKSVLSSESCYTMFFHYGLRYTHTHKSYITVGRGFCSLRWSEGFSPFRERWCQVSWLLGTYQGCLMLNLSEISGWVVDVFTRQSL